MQYVPKPKDCGDGFYAVEETGWIECNKYGMIRDVRGYIFPGILSKGYLHFSYTDSEGIYRRERVHRIMAKTFLSHDYDLSFDELQVNHIDGNKHNNCLSNLEWCTHRENCRHAHRTGLITRNRIVQVKDLQTGEILDFPSMRKASEYLNTNDTYVCVYLKRGRLAPFAKRYDIKEVGDEWKFTSNDLGKVPSTSNREIFAYSADPEIPHKLFGSITVASEFFNSPRGTLSWCLRESTSKFHKSHFWYYRDEITDSKILDLLSEGKYEFYPAKEVKHFFTQKRQSRMVLAERLSDNQKFIFRNTQAICDFLEPLFNRKFDVMNLQKMINHYKGTYKGFKFEYIYKSRISEDIYQRYTDLLAGNSYQSFL